RYPKYLGVFGFFSMMIFRLPLMLDNRKKFWKLMGSGKNGTFDIKPDFNQWALLFTMNEPSEFIPSFIKTYLKFFKCDVKQIIMQPLEGHGLWDGKKVFGELSKQNNYDGIIAVLTRATIRINRLKNFWKNVDTVADKMKTTPGLILSYGIGELPWIKQATFSVWQNKESMKAFAYNMQKHIDVIKKTRVEKWYKEEMFVRFKILSVSGFEKDTEAKLLNLHASYDEA
ncbi:MAG TPA: spheroidene monooxygenase, partial [Parafilimonas sp.]